MTDRRSFITAALAAPIVIAAPALARPADPVDRYYAATDAVNANRMSDEDYTQVIVELDQWEPSTQRDLLRKFIAQYEEGGTPAIEYRLQMVEQAKRLIS
ncbi:hypothetical protein [Sphingobium chungbukense]|uniref:Uncharacterized protein n=1 Tax=Sphingobium chungbukense TaxID=56193 RepID=A0A0M3AUY2_9SPHN|nr:hypothetical protein [Sphingobium chungbukense]KKW92696.1 hypothetical protein YP76_07120 [Sphingobium chungbukense]